MINPFTKKLKTVVMRVDPSFKDLVSDIKEESELLGKNYSETKITKILGEILYSKIKPK